MPCTAAAGRREKTHTIISIDAEKASENPIPFRKKALGKQGREKIPQVIQSIYEKPTANIILNGKRLNIFPKIRKTRVPTAAMSTQHSAASSSDSNRDNQQKINK